MTNNQKMIGVLGTHLEGIFKFGEACNVLSSQKIPDSYHADLLSKMDYDVVWEDLDPNHAKISKHMVV